VVESVGWGGGWGGDGVVGDDEKQGLDVMIYVVCILLGRNWHVQM
jgi:hypothetical protein